MRLSTKVTVIERTVEKAVPPEVRTQIKRTPISLLTLVVILFALLTYSTAASANSYKIAAVVNDDIISSVEFNDRMRLIISTSAVPSTITAQKMLAKRVMRNLIDEKLQLQAARKYNITASDAEIMASISNIEKQRGKEPGSLIAYMKNNNIPIKSFKDQLAAQISWSKLIKQRIAPRITISDEEVIQERAALSHRMRQKEEVLLSGIILPATPFTDMSQLRKTADIIMSRIRKGEDFVELAKEFSFKGEKDAEPTWADVDRLDPLVAGAILNLAKGKVSNPIYLPAGIQIIKLHDRRVGIRQQDAEMFFKQIILSLDNDAPMQEVDALMSIAHYVAKYPGSCRDKNISGVVDSEGLNIDIGYIRTRFSMMSDEIKPIVKDLKVGTVSEPFATPDGIHLLMLCEKMTIPVVIPNEEKVRQRLFSQKVELEAQKYLRDLRRRAFIDVRI